MSLFLSFAKQDNKITHVCNVAYEWQKKKAKEFYKKLDCPHYKHFKYDDEEGFDLVNLARGKLQI